MHPLSLLRPADPRGIRALPLLRTFISKEDAPSARKPIWILVGVVACLYVVYRWIVFG